jgi:hypothetical protein
MSTMSANWCGRNFHGRVAFHEGDYELRPGITVHWVGASGGLQIVRVHTRRGWIVLASDASLLPREPALALTLPDRDRRRGHAARVRTNRDAGGSPDHVVAGHDPATMRLYAPAGPEGLEIVSLADPA